MKKYTIKPIEWKAYGSESVYAETCFGCLYVMPFRLGSATFQWSNGSLGRDCNSIQDGKDQAETWYIDKILSALKESS